MTIPVSIRTLLDDHRAVWWIFGTALFVRLLLLILLHDSYYTSGMAQGELARNIVEGRGFVVNIPFADSIGALSAKENRLVDVHEGVERFSPADSPSDFRPFIAYMMPGQGILLAGTYVLTGSYTYLPLQTLQAIIDACGVFLLIGLGESLFNRRVGLVAAMLFSIYIPEARLAITATRDAWMPIIYLGAAYAAVRMWKEPSVRRAFVLGLVVAIGAYFRSEILLLPVWVGGTAILAGRSWRISASNAAVAMIPVVILLLPWTIRNYVVFDRIIPTNTGLWVAMWQSFGEYENDFGAVNNDVVSVGQMRAAGHDEPFDSPEYDALFRPKVMQVLAERPFWVGWTILRRLARIPFQMHAWGLSTTDDIHGSASPYPTGTVDIPMYIDLILRDPPRLIVHAVARTVNLILFAGVAWWFWRHRLRGWQAGLILFCVPLYNVLVHAVIGVHARYILPTNSIHLIFLAALFVPWMHGWMRNTEE